MKSIYVLAAGLFVVACAQAAGNAQEPQPDVLAEAVIIWGDGCSSRYIVKVADSDGSWIATKWFSPEIVSIPGLLDVSTIELLEDGRVVSVLPATNDRQIYYVNVDCKNNTITFAD